jgi:hypothetical protein
MRFSLLWDVTFQDNILIPSKDQVLHKELLLVVLTYYQPTLQHPRRVKASISMQQKPEI